MTLRDQNEFQPAVYCAARDARGDLASIVVHRPVAQRIEASSVRQAPARVPQVFAYQFKVKQAIAQQHGIMRPLGYEAMGDLIRQILHRRIGMNRRHFHDLAHGSEPTPRKMLQRATLWLEEHGALWRIAISVQHPAVRNDPQLRPSGPAPDRKRICWQRGALRPGPANHAAMNPWDVAVAVEACTESRGCDRNAASARTVRKFYFMETNDDDLF